jgi:peptidoglycan/xylan/chitin deacetylase (PgdA/CDA1 family)
VTGGSRSGRGARTWLRPIEHRLQRWSASPEWLKLSVLAGLGSVRRLPNDPEQLYVLCYHEVSHSSAGRFEAALRQLADAGRFVSWPEALDILSGRVSTNGPAFCLTFDDGHTCWTDVILPILVRQELPATFFVVTSLVESPGRDGALTWPDCRKLVSHGMTVGSHSVTHRPLAVISDGDVHRELADSKAELEGQLGVEVRDFCAPYGQPGKTFDPVRDVRLAAHIGYRCFVTTVRGPMRPGDSPYAIRRTVMQPEWSTAIMRGRLLVPR